MADNAALIPLVQDDITLLDGTQTLSELTILKVAASKLGMDTTDIDTRINAISMTSATTDALAENAIANSLGGASGGLEIGQFVRTVANTLEGKPLLSCDGTQIDEVTYPALAAMLGTSQYIASTQKSTGGPLTSMSGAHAVRTNQLVCSDDGTTLYHFAGDGNAGADSRGGYTTGLYGSALGNTITGSANSAELDSLTNVHAACSDDGSVAMIVGVNAARSRMLGWYRNGGNLTLDTNMESTLGIFIRGAPLPAITGNGLFATVAIYDSANSPNTRILVDTSPTSLSSFSNGIDTGLPAGIPHSYAIDNDGSNTYLVIGATLYTHKSLQVGGSWTLVNSALPFSGYLEYTDGLACTGDGTGLLASYLSSSVARPLDADRWWLSSDSGVTTQEVIKEALYTDNYSNRLSVKILSIKQKRSGHLGYLVERKPVDTSSIVTTTYEFIVTTDRSPTWLVDTYINTAGQHILDNMLDTWSLSDMGYVLDFDVLAPEQFLMFKNAGNSNGYVNRVNVIVDGSFAPGILNTKIVAEA